MITQHEFASLWVLAHQQDQAKQHTLNQALQLFNHNNQINLTSSYQTALETVAQQLLDPKLYQATKRWLTTPHPFNYTVAGESHSTSDHNFNRYWHHYYTEIVKQDTQ